MNGHSRTVHDIILNGYALVPITSAVSEAISATYHAGYEFFRSPSEEKLRSVLPHDCGYRPKGIEYSQSEEHPDEMESFTATAHLSDISPINSRNGRNLYAMMRSVIELLEPLAEQLASELAKKINPRFDTSKLRGSFHERSCLQLNYSQSAQCNAEFINEPHEDGHLLTLAIADAPGLEIQSATGDFKPVRRNANTLVAMPGDTAYFLSGGIVKPLYHQVRRDENVLERLALIYFGDIDPARCEPWIRNEVNDNVDIGARVRANSARFGLRSWD